MNRKTKLAVSLTVGVALLIGVGIALLVVYVVHPRRVVRNELQATLTLATLRLILGPQKADIGMPTYYINLDRSAARRRRFEDQLKEFSTHATRIPAVDGRNIDLDVSTQGVDGTYTFKGQKRSVSVRGYLKSGERRLPCSKGELGCTLSHLHAIRTAFDNGDALALIFEDDVTFELMPFWPQTLIDIVGSAPSGWEILNLTSSRACSREGFDVHTPVFDYSAQAYIINRKGMSRLSSLVFHEHTTRFVQDRRIENWEWILADWFLFNTARTYTFLTYSPFTSFNCTTDHDSTLHPQETPKHQMRVSRFKKWFTKRVSKFSNYFLGGTPEQCFAPCSVGFVNFGIRDAPHVALHTKSFRKYAKRHGYSYTHHASWPNPDKLPVNWLKLEFVAAMLDADGAPDVVVWVDSDTVVTRMHSWLPIHLVFQKHSDKSIFIGRDEPGTRHQPFCAGVFALRNNDTSRAFLSECLDALKSNPTCRDTSGNFAVRGVSGRSDCFEQGVINNILEDMRHPFVPALQELERTVVCNYSHTTHTDCLILHRFGNKNDIYTSFKPLAYL